VIEMISTNFASKNVKAVDLLSEDDAEGRIALKIDVYGTGSEMYPGFF
jgi:hypothetical protein